MGLKSIAQGLHRARVTKEARINATRAVIERLRDRAELDKASMIAAAEAYGETMAKLKRAEERLEALS